MQFPRLIFRKHPRSRLLIGLQLLLATFLTVIALLCLAAGPWPPRSLDLTVALTILSASVVVIVIRGRWLPTLVVAGAMIGFVGYAAAARGNKFDRIWQITQCLAVGMFAGFVSGLSIDYSIEHDQKRNRLTTPLSQPDQSLEKNDTQMTNPSMALNESNDPKSDICGDET